MRKLILWPLAAVGLFGVACSNASAATCSAYPHTLANGTTADATQVMDNFGSILSCANTLAPLASPSFSGNVGINVASPIAALDVLGNINVDAASGYKLGGNTILVASTVNNSVAVGASSASAWVQSSTANLGSIAIGTGALAAVPGSGYSDNIGIGSAALFSVTTGADNVGIGANALHALTSGSNNFAMGRNSQLLNTTGVQNTSVGTYTLYNNTGSNNTAVGMSALTNNTTGSYNVEVGVTAAYYDSNASSTVAIGGNAAVGTASYSASYFTVVGFGAGQSLATGANFNTLIGFQSGNAVSTGSGNVLLGSSSVSASVGQVTTGSNNIAIGSDVAVASPTASYQLDIGNFIYGTGLSGTGTAISPGAIGIGLKAPAYPLDVAGDIRTSTCVRYAGGGPLGTCTSDAMLKRGVTPFKLGLAVVDGLRPVNYYYNGLGGNPDDGLLQLGLIAQDVEKVAPSLVGTRLVRLRPADTKQTAVKTVNYGALTYMTINAVQELSASVKALKAENAQYAEQIAALRDKVAVLERKAAVRTASVERR